MTEISMNDWNKTKNRVSDFFNLITHFYLASIWGMSKASQRDCIWDPSRRSDGPNNARMPCSICPHTYHKQIRLIIIFQMWS